VVGNTGGAGRLDTNGIVRTVLISAFIVALILGTTGFYLILHDRAIQRQAVEAGRLLTTATAIRNYTDTNVAAALRGSGPDSFHVETVPAFAAQTVYHEVQHTYPGYTYREPALKPTNPADLPTPFEVALIDKFRDDPGLKELAGVRDEGNGRLYYVARPIVAHEACLACHDTPQRAPAGMVAKYGPANGFGWKAGEIVAIQSLTVPAAEELRETGEIALILGGGLLVVFVATYFALTLSIDALVVRPLHALAAAADSASRDSEARMTLPMSGAREIREIGSAIERLRLSLAKALKRLPADDAASRT
jgi:protein-histidine pros-kinase